MGKGRTQNDAKCGLALDLLVSWRISMEVTEQFELEERRIIMTLSQVYVEWERPIEAHEEA
jgi:hypothetical protein